MKLKVKHVQQPQQAYRLEVPSDYTWSALRSAVVDTVPFAGEVASSEVALSLNKKNPLDGDGNSSLTSMGICSGDLLWVLAPPAAAAATASAVSPAAAAASAPAVTDMMDVDHATAAPHAQQQHPPPGAAAAAGDVVATMDADPIETTGAQHVDLGSYPGPDHPWMPDVLLKLLEAAAAAAAVQPGIQQQQQQQQGAVLSPAQILLLTAHAALLDCGFISSTWPSHTARASAAPGHAAAGAAAQPISAPSCSSSMANSSRDALPYGRGAGDNTGLSYEQLQQLLRGGPGGIYSLSYRLPHDDTAAAGSNAACQPGQSDSSMGVSVELRGLDMGQHLVLLGSIKPSAAAAAAAAGSSSSLPRSSSGRLVATLTLLKSDVTAPQHTAATPAGTTSNQPQQQQQQQQKQQEMGAAVSVQAVCVYRDLHQLWVRLKDQLGLPLLTAGCCASGLPAPVGLNSLTYELQETILALLEAKDLAALCCSCSPMRHRASTDALWRPLFDREFPAPLDHEQQQQQQSTSKPTPPQQQQQQPTGQAEQGHVTAVPVASSTSSSSSVIQQPQQQQGEPSSMHIRLQYLLSHGQRYTLRHSCLHLRQEAGRRGWKWAFGAAWTHRARLLAEAEHNRRLGPMPFHMPPHPNPMPWGPLRPRHPMMPPNIIGGDYDRLPNVAIGGGGGLGGLPGVMGASGLGFSGGGANLGFGGAGGAVVGPGSGGALFSSGGLGQAGSQAAGFRGAAGGLPGFGTGRRGNGSNTRLY